MVKSSTSAKGTQPAKPVKDQKVSRQSWVNSKILKSKDEKRSERIAEALLDNQTVEILKTEDTGLIETEGMEKSSFLTQERIAKEVDMNTRQKMYSLTLDQFGPYKVYFDRPGRHLLLSGEKGHLAMMDALRQDLVCEFHVDDRIFDGCFLHDWDMFATAQNKYLHIYDSQGVELHCMRTIRSPRALQFLPYHYLLVSCSETGFLSYLDVSVGSIVNAKNTHCGKPTCFIQNPHNAVVLHGSSWGRVSMWSPGERDALVTMFCHHGPVLAAAVDLEGKYLVTSGNDAHVKIWDLRTYEALYDYTVPVPVSALALSQTNMLALGIGATVQMWNDVFAGKIKDVYLKEPINGHKLQNLAFRPFEDQLLLGFNDGIRSIIVPGSGEANLDTYELNPFESKKQRRERNVQKLLDKLLPEQIVLDPDNMF